MFRFYNGSSLSANLVVIWRLSPPWIWSCTLDLSLARQTYNGLNMLGMWIFWYMSPQAGEGWSVLMGLLLFWHGSECEAQIGMSGDHLIAMRAPERPARGWAVLSGAPGCFSGIYFWGYFGYIHGYHWSGGPPGGWGGPFLVNMY